MNLEAFFVVMAGFLVLAFWAAGLFRVGNFFADHFGEFAGAVAIGAWFGLPFAIIGAVIVGSQ